VSCALESTFNEGSSVKNFFLMSFVAGTAMTNVILIEKRKF
jgi:hypothetical protein